jgi:hypothetical protein
MPRDDKAARVGRAKQIRARIRELLLGKERPASADSGEAASAEPGLRSAHQPTSMRELTDEAAAKARDSDRGRVEMTKELRAKPRK